MNIQDDKLLKEMTSLTDNIESYLKLISKCIQYKEFVNFKDLELIDNNKAKAIIDLNDNDHYIEIVINEKGEVVYKDAHYFDTIYEAIDLIKNEIEENENLTKELNAIRNNLLVDSAEYDQQDKRILIKKKNSEESIEMFIDLSNIRGIPIYVGILNGQEIHVTNWIEDAELWLNIEQLIA